RVRFDPITGSHLSERTLAGTYETSVSRRPCIIADAQPQSEGEPVAILRVIDTAHHWPSGGCLEDSTFAPEV
ncbi:MAG: hypothetical protein CGW95_15085, partial [Phenylobacterium zucineum]